MNTNNEFTKLAVNNVDAKKTSLFALLFDYENWTHFVYLIVNVQNACA